MSNLSGDSADAGVPAVKGEYTDTGNAYVHDGGKGVHGYSKNGYGVHGISEVGRGVVASSDSNYGLRAHSRTLSGARCSSDEGTGVEGEARGAGSGVRGASTNGIGIHGIGGRLAGFFEGDVEVTGDVRLVNADCAEEFDVSCADKVEPGTVMVLGREGALCESRQAYDKRVAGVISGAGYYKPGIVLDRQQTASNRQPIALMGKVFCKVDAQYGAIEVGDLLTTSDTPGHAMQTTDPMKAFGTVIGKALRPLKEGQGLIPILIALQ